MKKVVYCWKIKSQQSAPVELRNKDKLQALDNAKLLHNLININIYILAI